MRVPVGFLFVTGGVLILLLATAYGIGFNRGEHAGRQLRAQDQQDVLQRQSRMNAVSEVAEPGGALASVSIFQPSSDQSASTSDSVTDSTPTSGRATRSETLAPGLDESRTIGLNYYVIDHPSQQKVDQLITFCLENGLQARRTTTLGGGAKVYVLPGFEPGGSRNPEILRLLDRIREVGILWKRLAPRQNSDFSTRYAEKYKGPA